MRGARLELKDSLLASKFRAEMVAAMLVIIWRLIVGLIVGALAKLIMPGKDPGGVIVTMLLGIAGSFIAGWIGRALGWYAAGQRAGFIASVIGAIALLAIYRAIIGRRGGGGQIRRAA